MVWQFTGRAAVLGDGFDAQSNIAQVFQYTLWLEEKLIL